MKNSTSTLRSGLDVLRARLDPGVAMVGLQMGLVPASLRAMQFRDRNLVVIEHDDVLYAINYFDDLYQLPNEIRQMALITERHHPLVKACLQTLGKALHTELFAVCSNNNGQLRLSIANATDWVATLHLSAIKRTTEDSQVTLEAYSPRYVDAVQSVRLPEVMTGSAELTLAA